MAKTILILYQYFSPAKNAGGIIRSLNNLIQLLQQDYVLYVLTSAYDLGENDPLPVKQNQWVQYDNHSWVYYAAKGSNFQTLIKEVNPEIIYINGLFSVSFFIKPLLYKKLTKHKIPIIIAPRGMLQEGALQVKSLKKKIFLKLFSILGFPRLITKWHATDQQEVRDIEKVFNTSNIHLAYDTPDVKPREMAYKEKVSNAAAFTTISLVTEKKNILEAIETFKKLAVENPAFSIIYDIFGPVKDQEYWHTCQQAMNNIPENLRINYKGNLGPDKVYDYLAGYHYFILPTKGENFGHAIFEAFKIGKPVITTNKTPWNELEKKQAGWNYPLNDRRTLKTILINAFQMNDMDYQVLCKGAQQMAEVYLQKHNFIEQYHQLFEVK